jgi:hypothetical protein
MTNNFPRRRRGVDGKLMTNQPPLSRNLMSARSGWQRDNLVITMKGEVKGSDLTFDTF